MATDPNKETVHHHYYAMIVDDGHFKREARCFETSEGGIDQFTINKAVRNIMPSEGQGVLPFMVRLSGVWGKSQG